MTVKELMEQVDVDKVTEAFLLTFYLFHHPMEADVVVTDHEVKCTEEAQIIREYDFEKIRMLMEDAK